MIHGDDEKKFKEKFERNNSGEHLKNEEMLAKIKEQNRLKLENGEAVRLVPWKADQRLDPTGILFGSVTY